MVIVRKIFIGYLIICIKNKVKNKINFKGKLNCA